MTRAIIILCRWKGAAMVNEKINSWTFEETIKTAENLMKNEKNIFKWDVLRHLKDFVETYQKEIQQYRTIGTVEECRAAMEKQTAKKVKSISQVKDGDSYVGLIGRCPCCGDILEEDTVYCDCGQRLDWETSNEIDSKRNS